MGFFPVIFNFCEVGNGHMTPLNAFLLLNVFEGGVGMGGGDGSINRKDDIFKVKAKYSTVKYY